jgi:hypothetical protein
MVFETSFRHFAGSLTPHPRSAISRTEQRILATHVDFAGRATNMPDEEWIKKLEDGRNGKFIYQELPEDGPLSSAPDLGAKISELSKNPQSSGGGSSSRRLCELREVNLLVPFGFETRDLLDQIPLQSPITRFFQKATDCLVLNK